MFKIHSASTIININKSLLNSTFFLLECGTVPEYTVPTLDFATEPRPLMKEVTCTEEIIGNWVVIQQTREKTVLQFSEFNILWGEF